MNADLLWAEFPKDLGEFERRFPDEESCRQFLIDLRWAGAPRCGKCGFNQTWKLSNGRFECKRCGYQISVTAGTLFHRTQKPLKLWFRAMWEIASRKNGINACELQRLMGFASYGTAWTWLHKLRRAMAGRTKGALDGEVLGDDAYIGGRARGKKAFGRGTEKSAVVVAAQKRGGRARLGHIPDTTARSLIGFYNFHLNESARLTTDAHRAFVSQKYMRHNHERIVIKYLPASASDPLGLCHIVVALLKRWWLGTYHGSISRKHLQAYLEEFEFRFNRRKTNGVGRITCRLLEVAVTSKPITYANISAQPIAA